MVLQKKWDKGDNTLMEVQRMSDWVFGNCPGMFSVFCLWSCNVITIDSSSYPMWARWICMCVYTASAFIFLLLKTNQENFSSVNPTPSQAISWSEKWWWLQEDSQYMIPQLERVLAYCINSTFQAPFFVYYGTVDVNLSKNRLPLSAKPTHTYSKSIYYCNGYRYCYIYIYYYSATFPI